LDGNKPESYAAHMPASIDDVSSVINVICVLRFAKVTNPLNIMMSLYGFPV
jgi:hypothetical protein